MPEFWGVPTPLVSAVCLCVSFLLHHCGTHSTVELDLSDSHELSACTLTAATKTRGYAPCLLVWGVLAISGLWQRESPLHPCLLSVAVITP